MRTISRPIGRAYITVYLGSYLAAASMFGSARAAEPASTVIFDNTGGGLDPAGASPASQSDAAFPFDAGAADDFLLSASPQCRWSVTGVRWTGRRWNELDPGAISGFRITFWPDEESVPAGGGANTPNAAAALAAFDLPADAAETALGGGAYSYEATLPQALELMPGVRYWIEIQAKIPFPPQWGLHITHGRQGMAPVQYFDLLDIFAWTQVPDDGDLSFQLLGLPAEVNCDDADACTVDACVNGTCSSSPRICDDGNACTTDSCDTQLGCLTADILCDDQDPCTVDSCDPQSGCSSSPMNCADDDPCTVDVCEAGVCEHFGPPDIDGDGDADLKDFDAVSACFETGLSTGAACQCMDFNADGKMDLTDFAAFQRLYTGSR